MKVTSVEIHPASSSIVAVLGFRDPTNQNPYNIKGIDGLSPDQIVNSRFMGPNGAPLNDLAMLNRDMVILIELNPDFESNQTFSELRDELYKLIWTSRTGLTQFQFKDDTTVVAVVYGTVSKFETTQFAKKQMIQMTVRCEEPLLRAPSRVDVYTDDFSSRHFTIIDNKSNAPHGFRFYLKVRNNVETLMIGSPDTSVPGGIGLKMKPTVHGGFQVNDFISGSSEFNNKYLYLIRDAEFIPIIDSIQFGSTWPLMFPGETDLFMVDVDNLLTDVIRIDSMSYYPTYWGV